MSYWSQRINVEKNRKAYSYVLRFFMLDKRISELLFEVQKLFDLNWKKV